MKEPSGVAGGKEESSLPAALHMVSGRSVTIRRDDGWKVRVRLSSLLLKKI